MRPGAELLDALRAAVAAASGRPTATNGPPPFAGFFDDELARCLSPLELAALLDHAEHREAALAAARSGDLLAARDELDAACALLRASDLSEETTALATAFLEPVEAYLQYRLGEYDAARELLLDASALDGALVRDCGFAFLSAHRLQIAHNLLRIQRRLGDREEAVALVAAFLDYLELGLDSVPESLASPRRCLDAVPEKILDFYFEAFAAEVAALLAGCVDPQTRALFRPLASHAECEGTLAPGAHAWLATKSLALNGSPPAAITAAARLVRREAVDPSFRVAVLSDAAELCRRVGVDSDRLAHPKPVDPERRHGRARHVSPPAADRRLGSPHLADAAEQLERALVEAELVDGADHLAAAHEERAVARDAG
jgi:hypothetical protein